MIGEHNILSGPLIEAVHPLLVDEMFVGVHARVLVAQIVCTIDFGLIVLIVGIGVAVAVMIHGTRCKEMVVVWVCILQPQRLVG